MVVMLMSVYVHNNVMKASLLMTTLGADLKVGQRRRKRCRLRGAIRGNGNRSPRASGERGRFGSFISLARRHRILTHRGFSDELCCGLWRRVDGSWSSGDGTS